nr:MAG TPA: hypothetical protein [Bacteriophage sp.]
MKLKVGNSVYEMTAEQLKAVLYVASKQVSFGIYAVKKDGICELRKDHFDTKCSFICCKQTGFVWNICCKERRNLRIAQRSL